MCRFSICVAFGKHSLREILYRDVAQSGSAPVLGTGGHGFKSYRPEKASCFFEQSYHSKRARVVPVHAFALPKARHSKFPICCAFCVPVGNEILSKNVVFGTQGIVNFQFAQHAIPFLKIQFHFLFL